MSDPAGSGSQAEASLGMAKASTEMAAGIPYALADITDPNEIRFVEMNDVAAEAAARIGVQLGEAIKASQANDAKNIDGRSKFERLHARQIAAYATDVVFSDKSDKPILFRVEATETAGPDDRRRYIRVTWSETAMNPVAEAAFSGEVLELAHALTTGALSESSVGAALIDVKHRKYAALNHAYAAILGAPRRELIGRETADRIPSTDSVTANSGRAFEIISGQIDSFTTTVNVPNDPIIQRTVTISAAGSRFPRADYLVVYVNDSPAPDPLSWSDPSDSMRSIMRAGIPTGVYSYALIDHDWRLQFLAPAPEGFGEESDSLIGLSVLPNIHSTDLAAFVEAGERVRTGETSEVTVRVNFRSALHPLGHFPVVSTFARPLGMPSGWLTITSRLDESLRNNEDISARIAAITEVVRTEEPGESFEGAFANTPGIAELVQRFDLTERERQIVMLLAGGYRVRTMSRTLHLSNGTIRNYLSAIFHKVGVRNQAELVELLLGE